MNIFARPLFEAVADILPTMRYAVEEILINASIWKQKIGEEKEKLKAPNLSLGLLAPSFAVDPTPSPFSGAPTRPATDASAPLPSQPTHSIQAPASAVEKDDADRRASNGSIHVPVSNSQISSSNLDSSAGVSGTRSRENQSQSRRESGDASLTAILVTQTSNPIVNEAQGNEPNHTPEPRSKSPGTRKDTLIKTSPKKEKECVRPVTAPSPPRRSQGKSPSPHDPSFYLSSRPLGVGPDFDSATNLFPMPQRTSQSHSEVDLSHAANGNLDGSKMQQWEANKVSGDSTVSRSDGSRDSVRRSQWWPQIPTRRRNRDLRNGDREHPSQQKEMMLDPTLSNSTSDTASPTATSPGRTSRTAGKLKSFFKRKPRNSSDHEKHLSSFGSSSQLRTPPTSDPGQSVTSDE